MYDVTGTVEERGIQLWREVPDTSDEDSEDMEYNNLNLSMKTYDFPLGMNLIRNLRWGKYVPFFPTFEDFDTVMCPCTKSRGDDFDLEQISVASKETSNKDKDDMDSF